MATRRPWSADQVWVLTPLVLSVRRKLVLRLWSRPPGWIFPTRSSAPKDTQWQPSVLTRGVIDLLIDSAPWDGLMTPMPGLKFPNRPWFVDLQGRLALYYQEHVQAIWKATHHFPITAAMRKDAWFKHYYHARKRRRTKAGAAWAAIRDHVVKGIQRGECDLGVFLFPAVLHLPVRRAGARGIEADGGEWYPGYGHLTPIGTLHDALIFADHQEPWRNQYRSSPMDHPAFTVSRLRTKYSP